jgi:hypothetical protein
MSRSAWINVLLAAAVAALAAWAYFKPAHNPAPDHALSDLKPADVTSIRIERGAEPAMVLEKRQGAWVLTAPFGARGNELRAQQLVEIAQARSAHRYPAADLGRFELDSPQARVTLNGQEFRFGLMSAVTREQYVQTGGAVYAVHARHGAVLPSGAADLVSPRLLGPGETPVKFESSEFSVAQQDGSWRQTPPAPDAGPDDFVRWVDAWRHAIAARVEPYEMVKPAAESIRIGLKDGGEVVVAVLAREPEVVLARADEKLKYSFRGAAAKRMLSPPAAPAPDKK